MRAQPDTEGLSVDLTGDAYLVFTAPFYAKRNPLEPQIPCVLPKGDDLDGTGALIRSDISLSSLLRGTLTYEQPLVNLLTCFAASATWCDELQRDLNELRTGHLNQCVFEGTVVTGILFPDGYGSIAVTLRVEGGWEPAHRSGLLAVVGRDGRDEFAAELRSMLLKPLRRMMLRCGAGAETPATLPYFNLTYAGSTDHPDPGRSSLDDDLRTLVYPDSPMPLTSCSPWRDEFFFAGYAYHVLATRRVRAAVEKLSLLLLVLNVTYSRLARTAVAASESMRTGTEVTDVMWLNELERRLRNEYESLVTPIFSYDHHALLLRDAILRSWDTASLQSRAENLVSMIRQAIELELANQQARRIRKVNLVIVVLTVLSAVATAEAAFSLFDRLFG